MITPHLDKIKAAINNKKCENDNLILTEILDSYNDWIRHMNSLTSTGKERVNELVKSLNAYKDQVEVDLIMKKASPFLYRQKGQLKLDNSIMEEFLVNLMIPEVVGELEGLNFTTGPQKAFMSLSFRPTNFASLEEKPEIVIKCKDQDFTLGNTVYYKFSSDASFTDTKTETGSLNLAVLAAECKINYDKTMFQECAGTATRLKQGVPFAKYYALVEYLDMEPEDCRLTDIDNVFVLRRTKRLPYEKRTDVPIVEMYRKEHPISSDVIWMFVQEIKNFLSVQWYDPNAALERGSFI